MTVVCAKKYPDRIEIAADSLLSTDGDDVRARDHLSIEKIKTQNGFTWGYAGPIYEHSLFSIFARTHKPASGNIDDVLDFFMEFGAWATAKSSQFQPRASYLIIVEDRLLTVFNGVYVEECINYGAIGSGMDYALTALYLGKSPKEASAVACDLCLTCALPIWELIIPLEVQRA